MRIEPSVSVVAVQNARGQRRCRPRRCSLLSVGLGVMWATTPVETTSPGVHARPGGGRARTRISLALHLFAAPPHSLAQDLKCRK